ncbi:hypothetical protein NOVO_00115 [Rickettsiales bacterium Ac37b]|nr:hypothetical protein NOVO_00115 [Rickettsiales bacterium Ac37b]
MTKNIVILLHGLSLTSHSMKFIEKSLEKKHYIIMNVDYPSRKYSIKELALEYIKPVIDKYSHFTNINFVTHSMGGVIIKYLLDNTTIANLGRVVMLCPPHKGSELVDFFEYNKFFRWYLGPAWLELKKRKVEVELPEQLRNKIGIIAGNKVIDPFFSQKLPLPNDGIVSVESVELFDTPTLLLPCNHLSILWNKEARNQIINFLRIGQFKQ